MGHSSHFPGGKKQKERSLKADQREENTAKVGVGHTETCGHRENNGMILKGF